MPIQSSGVIRFSDIQDEFGGSNPIALSEYYRGGSYVGSHNDGVPASGTINLTQFYDSTSVLPSTSITILVQGGGGSGGTGYSGSSSIGGRSSSGGSSSVSGNLASGSAFSVVGAGGLGGRNGGASSHNGEGGQASSFGNGGSGGGSSHDGNPGRDAPSNHYGAGGGGGAGNLRIFQSDGDGGEGGYAGSKVTSTKTVTKGSTLTVVVGSRGVTGSSDTRRGGRGAGGYVKITHNGNDTTYTSPGTYTYTVPST